MPLSFVLFIAFTVSLPEADPGDENFNLIIPYKTPLNQGIYIWYNSMINTMGGLRALRRIRKL